MLWRIPTLDVREVVVSIFRDLAAVGWTIGLGVEHLTGQDVARAFREVLGEEVVYRPIPHDDHRSLGFREAVEIGNTVPLQNHIRDRSRSTALRPLVRPSRSNTGYTTASSRLGPLVSTARDAHEWRNHPGAQVRPSLRWSSCRAG